MPGVRLHHPDLRNCTYTLIHLGRPYTAPFDCGVCGMVHSHKTYHLGLDNAGDVIVSETVFARLQEAGLDELQELGIIADPPPLFIGLDGPPEDVIVVSRENGHVKG